MSHTITIQLNNKQMYINNCNNFIEQIKQMQNKINEFNNKINLDILLKECNQIIETINKKQSYSESEHMELLKSINTLEKNVANTFSFVKNSLKDKYFNELIKINEFNFFSNVQKYGILANEVVEYLQLNNIKINEENFKKYLSVVEQSKLSNEKINKFITESFDYIDNTNIDSNLKLLLKKEIKNIMDLNQLKDVNSIIQSKQREYNDVLFLAKDVISKLKLQNFKIDNKQKKIWEIIDNDIVLKLSLINDQNNVVQIIFNSNRQIKYKLGNYIGHACEKTTNKLLKDLETLGYTYSIINIKRDYEQVKTMKQDIQKERGK